jgi:hypothetical protein
MSGIREAGIPALDPIMQVHNYNTMYRGWLFQILESLDVKVDCVLSTVVQIQPSRGSEKRKIGGVKVAIITENPKNKVKSNKIN